jgi:hypothetical protein
MPEKLLINDIIQELDPNAEAKKKAAAAAKVKKQAQLKKEAADRLKLKPKFYYDVKVEAMLPATLTYRILAEDAQQAAELIKGTQPNSVQHRLIGRKELKLTVYDAGSTMIKWMKRLVG